MAQAMLENAINPLDPHPSQPVARPRFSKSLLYQDKRLFLFNRVQSRLKALNYYYQRHKPICDCVDYYDCENSYQNHIDRLLSCLNLLDINNFICNSAYLEAYRIFNQFPSSNDKHCKQLFGFVMKRISSIDRDFNYWSKLNQSTTKLLKHSQIVENFELAKMRKVVYDNFKHKLRLDCLAQRSSILKKRLKYEMAERSHQGWFFIFATLTVDNTNLCSVFSSESSAWTDYIRSIDRDIGITCFGSWRKALKERIKGNDFHRYFAVVEYGTKTGRPHLHVIHMCKQLPYHVTDPNLDTIQPYNYNIEYFRKFWEFGKNSVWMPMRYSQSDSFGQLGWRWPVKQKISINGDINYEVVRFASWLRCANYVCKYINKSYTENMKGELKWRTKMSRNLGLKILYQLTKSIKINQNYQIMRSQTLNLKLLNQKIPLPLVKRISCKFWLTHRLKKLKMLMMNLPMMNITNRIWVLQRLECKENILKSFVDSISEIHEYNPEKIGDTTMLNLQEIDIFNSSLQSKLDQLQFELFGKFDIVSSNGGGFTGGSY